MDKENMHGSVFIVNAFLYTGVGYKCSGLMGEVGAVEHC